MTGQGQKGKGFGLGLGKMKELADAFKKAQEVQEGAKKLQEELDELEVPGEAGGGLVKVYLSGNQEPRRVEISPDVLGEGADVVSELMLTAMQAAYSNSTAMMRQRMEELTGGLNLPGM
jgi:DNA-binding YbaB/EbfC family protein